MSHPNVADCPRCGAPIRKSGPDPLCPACLMSGALLVPDNETVAVPPPLALPSEPDEFPREFGSYRLLGILGQGGMGTVYEAEQLATARRVALKVLGHQLDSPEMRQRFLREGRLAAGVSHPNSLYIFGTEEIEGRPAITMEIAGGGTLHDRLKRHGPLPVAETVDAILDVISGLEAAYSAGVLHRDIKPSNCFVSPDGSTKIGDFGLSVSTVTQDDSYVTGTGTILGTPAFASPEQLRGTALDVRSDIYSLGASLFTLLAGKPPIQGRNAVEIVAAALAEKPISLSELRDDLPTGLAQVVARCLSKKPEKRYSDYAVLRNALLPFSSARPDPAPLGRRFFAGAIDFAVCSIIPAVFILSFFEVDVLEERAMLTERTPEQLFAWVALVLFGTLYFGVFEGIWGAGVGKALMGFRVARTGGHEPVLGRALLRGFIGRTLGDLGKIVALTTMSASQYLPAAAFVSVAGALSGLSAFATMRRRNGFATLWDLVTETRVVVRPQGAVRPTIDVESQPDASTVATEAIGPYMIDEEIIPSRWITARDSALRRTVWLRRRTSELSRARRDVARPGRTRWLQRVDTHDATWDVFEALPGVPFSSLLDDADVLPWGSLRHWLYDLASELDSAVKDDTLPPSLSLDHIWITAQGRAIVLDEPWPSSERATQLFPLDSLANRQRFLNKIASYVNPITVPLHAQPVLQSLANGSFERLSFLAGNLSSLLSKPAHLGSRLRAASLFAVPLGLIALITVSLVGYRITDRPLPPITDIWEAAKQGSTWGIEQHASFGTDLNVKEPLRGNTPLMVAATLGHTDAAAVLIDRGAALGSRRDDGATALHLAAFFGHVDTTRLLLQRGAEAQATDDRGWTPIDAVQRPWNEELEERYNSSEVDLALGTNLERRETARPIILAILRDPTDQTGQIAEGSTTAQPSARRDGFLLYGAFIMYTLGFLQAVIQLVALCVFRSTPGQLFFGFAVIDQQGAPAGRVRLLSRWLIAWSIPLVVLAWSCPGTYGGPYLYPLALLVPWLIGLANAALHPSRGPHDRCSGCWLVPR